MALRVNAVAGATSAAKQTAYNTAPLTTAEAGSVDFPLAALQDAAISAVATIVRTYANVGNHPLRANHNNVTASIANAANIPAVDSGSKPIIGVLGAVRDSSDGKSLTEQPVQIIEKITDNSDSFLSGEYYYYKIAGRRIYHTRTNVVIDCVCFDEATERAALASGSTPLADGLFDLAWIGAVSLLIADDSFYQQASFYGNLFQQGLAQLSNGEVTPTLINTTEPKVS